MRPDPTDIGSLLIARQAVSPEALASAVERQERTKSRLGTELLSCFDVDPKALSDALMAQARMRGETPDWIGILQTVKNATSLHYYRTSQAVAAARDALIPPEPGSS